MGDTKDYLVRAILAAATERPCAICGRESDLDRGWVRNSDDLNDQRVWWLCNDCIDRRGFRFDWQRMEVVTERVVRETVRIPLAQ